MLIQLSSSAFRHQVRRLSHHPSLALIDGCNGEGRRRMQLAPVVAWFDYPPPLNPSPAQSATSSLEPPLVRGAPAPRGQTAAPSLQRLSPRLPPSAGIYATFVLTVVMEEDQSRVLWPSCPSNGAPWWSGAAAAWAPSHAPLLLLQAGRLASTASTRSPMAPRSACCRARPPRRRCPGAPAAARRRFSVSTARARPYPPRRTARARTRTATMSMRAGTRSPARHRRTAARSAGPTPSARRSCTTRACAGSSTAAPVRVYREEMGASFLRPTPKFCVRSCAQGRPRHVRRKQAVAVASPAHDRDARPV